MNSALSVSTFLVSSLIAISLYFLICLWYLMQLFFNFNFVLRCFVFFFLLFSSFSLYLSHYIFLITDRPNTYVRMCWCMYVCAQSLPVLLFFSFFIFPSKIRNLCANSCKRCHFAFEWKAEQMNVVDAIQTKSMGRIAYIKGIWNICQHCSLWGNNFMERNN